MAGCIVSASDFMQFLVHQAPVYDKLIMADIRPTDSWVLNVNTATAPAHEGDSKRLDRFKHVFPNTMKVWNRFQAVTGCLGHPCDKTEHCIGWGSERIEYYPEQQSWCTPLLCYDQALHVTHAEQQWQYIISKILRPATSAIQSSFLRKRWLQHAGNHFMANASMTPFTFAWALGGAAGDDEIFFDTNAAPTQVFKLVPQMLQRRFNPLMLRGYAGMNPFAETSPFIEFVTDIDTCWDIDKYGGFQAGGTTVAGFPASNWQFTQWSEADKFWRYGFSGQLGNYQVRTDPMGLRFNYVGPVGVAPNTHRYQVILPYTNQTVAGAGGDPGLGSVDNPNYETACFGISGIHHKMGMTLLTQDATPINSEMPFSARDLGGKWQFVMDNLGVDEQGATIENKRRNKGQFIADFELWIRPEHTEFMEIFFHKREPLCVPEVDVCNPCEYPGSESYVSCPGACEQA